MCGKDFVSRPIRRAASGSPPHVRERLDRGVKEMPGLRITPACAGKTVSIALTGLPEWDHPRMCGKDLLESSLYRPVQGSPPHVRERLQTLFNAHSIVRITPACAGKTFK